MLRNLALILWSLCVAANRAFATDVAPSDEQSFQGRIGASVQDSSPSAAFAPPFQFGGTLKKIVVDIK
jgi:hypothetical protein